jgi:hypothetical protein
VVHDPAQAGIVRRTAAAGLAALALAGVAGGCGGGDEANSAKAAWVGTPAVAPHPEIPTDRIATGRIRNDGGSELKLFVNQARVLDARGTPVRATVRFAAGVTHSLYPPRDGPKENPLQQQERLGDAALIPPGETAPLTIAWHAGTADRKPVKVDLGPVQVPIPSAP